MSVTLNGIAVAFKPGINIKDKLTEDLDTGFIILPQTTALVVEPYKSKIVIVEGATKNMLVSDIKRVTSKFTGTKEYNYELGLISPTIQLQRIVLPNRSITQPLTGSKTPIFDILDRYVGMYSDFTISAALETLTEDTDCPEFQWNRPTLFEVINDLLSEVDAVVTFTTGSFTQLNYLDLNTDGSEITGDFTDIVETQNITDYAGKIECEVENAVVGTRNTRCIQWLALKTDASAVVTTDNFKLILEKPIYKINKVTQKIYYSSTETSADVTNYVVEKKIYDLAEPSISTGVVTGNKKRNRYYYEEGGTTIEGMSYHEDTWISMSSLRAIVNVFENAASVTVSNTDCLEFVFKVDYQAQETVKLISNKQTALGNSSTLINNQDTSYVDFRAFARKQQQTVNRLGNSTLTITRKIDDTSDLDALGDTYGDYKLAEREYSLYNNSVNFKGILSKNYILKDLFTGIKSERRYTSIASGNEALESNHIEELTLNLSNTDATTSAALENYLMHFGQADNGIEVVRFTTNEVGYLLVAPSSYWTEKSLILTWKMYDNFNAGITSDTTVSFAGTTIGMYNLPYTDGDGKFNYYSYKLYKSMSNTDLDSPANSSDWTSGLLTARTYPEYHVLNVTLNDEIYTSGNINRYKDNREITVETKQFNIMSDSNVIVGRKFFKNSSLTFAESADKSIFVAYSTTLTYEDGDQTHKGTIADPANLTVSRTANYYHLTSPDSSITIADLASWCIVDGADTGDGNLYLANNGNDEYIYLNKEA